MGQPKLTAEQSKAISLSGSDLLVSAAAGSGKTFVLVQRLMKAIADGKDITDFLIITYTRAAANELLSKIQKELSTQINVIGGDPEKSRHLRRQMLLLPYASIGTIHSFCARILRDNAAALNINPDFAIMDETEAEERKSRVLDAILDQYYCEINEKSGFHALADMLIQTRGDADLKQAIISVYENLRSLPDPEAWIKVQQERNNLNNIEDAGQTVWGRALMERTSFIVTEVRAQWSYIINKLRTEYKQPNKWADSLETLLVHLDKMKLALSMGWDAVSALPAPDFGRASVAKGEDASSLKEIHASCKKILNEELALYKITSDRLLSDMRAVAPQTEALYNLVLAFEKAFEAEKLTAGRLDYSDLEHLTLRLLYDSVSEKKLSKQAEKIAGQYCEIMIDEYQDVNSVQEMILHALSQNEKNRFMVGDMKQSIYRFRMADVTIFKEKYLNYPTFHQAEAEDGKAVKVLLPDNFRSSQGVIDGINTVFLAIMSESVGDLTYGEQEKLRFSRVNPNDTLTAAELVRIGETDAVIMPNEERRTFEARAAAQKIQSMIDAKETVWEKRDGQNGEEFYQRELSYNDFAVLLRTTKDVEEIYCKVFTEYGIPYCTLKGESWFTSSEVELMLDVLSVLDNPRQDIPLINVLQSPLFCVSYDEMASIRSENPHVLFYDAMLASKAGENSCKPFFTFLNKFRPICTDHTAEQILWEVMEYTHAAPLLSAAHTSSAVESNLSCLLQYISQFEKEGNKSLFRFVQHIRFLRENGKTPSGKESASGTGVNLMTIHKSKGLEYPVVLLCDTEHDFNLSDTKKAVLFHRDLGIGLYYRNRTEMYQYSTLARKAIAAALHDESVSEEMRVLYVALTRARDRLLVMIPPYYASGRTKNIIDADTEDSLLMPEWQASPLMVGRKTNYRSWILTAVLQNAEMRKQIYSPGIANTYPWIISRFIPGSSCKLIQPQEEKQASEKHEDNLAAEIQERISYQYHFTTEINLPSKVTATEIKNLLKTNEAVQALPASSRKISRPGFNSDSKPLSGSEKGTAIHCAMQFINYSECTTLSGIESELSRLVSQKYITLAQSDAVNRSALLQLFTSPLGTTLIESKNVHREFKFSLLTEACDILSVDSKEKILFQGIIDCWLEDEEGITVIDFKSDKIVPSNFENKINDYSRQVSLYAMALERITGKKVKDGIVYFFNINQAVSVLNHKK